jgi:hypothetical protein
MSDAFSLDLLPDMEPEVAVLMRRFEIHLRQLDPRIRLEGGPLRRLYKLGADLIVVISPHRDLFRVQTGGRPAWEARIRDPEEALAALARALDRYWALVARQQAKGASS